MPTQSGVQDGDPISILQRPDHDPRIQPTYGIDPIQELNGTIAEVDRFKERLGEVMKKTEDVAKEQADKGTTPNCAIGQVTLNKVNLTQFCRPSMILITQLSDSEQVSCLLVSLPAGMLGKKPGDVSPHVHNLSECFSALTLSRLTCGDTEIGVALETLGYRLGPEFVCTDYEGNRLPSDDPRVPTVASFEENLEKGIYLTTVNEVSIDKIEQHMTGIDAARLFMGGGDNSNHKTACTSSNKTFKNGLNSPVHPTSRHLFHTRSTIAVMPPEDELLQDQFARYGVYAYLRKPSDTATKIQLPCLFSTRNSINSTVSFGILSRINLVHVQEYGCNNSFGWSTTSEGPCPPTGGSHVLGLMRRNQDMINQTRTNGMRMPNTKKKVQSPSIYYAGSQEQPPPSPPTEEQPPPSPPTESQTVKLTDKASDDFTGRPTEFDLSSKMMMSMDDDGTRRILLMCLDSKKIEFLRPYIELQLYEFTLDERPDECGDDIIGMGIKITILPRSQVKTEHNTEYCQCIFHLQKHFGVTIPTGGGSIDVYNTYFAHDVKNNMTNSSTGRGARSLNGAFRAAHDIRSCTRLLLGCANRQLHFAGNCEGFTQQRHSVRVEVGLTELNNEDTVPKEHAITTATVERFVNRLSDVEQLRKMIDFIAPNTVRFMRLSMYDYLENLHATIDKYQFLMRGVSRNLNMKHQSKMYGSHLKMMKFAAAKSISALGIYCYEGGLLLKHFRENPSLTELVEGLSSTRNNFTNRIRRSQRENSAVCGETGGIHRLMGHIEKKGNSIDIDMNKFQDSILTVKKTMEDAGIKGIPPIVGSSKTLMRILKPLLKLFYSNTYLPNLSERKAKEKVRKAAYTDESAYGSDDAKNAEIEKINNATNKAKNKRRRNNQGRGSTEPIPPPPTLDEKEERRLTIINWCQPNLLHIVGKFAAGDKKGKKKEARWLAAAVRQGKKTVRVTTQCKSTERKFPKEFQGASFMKKLKALEKKVADEERRILLPEELFDLLARHIIDEADPRTVGNAVFDYQTVFEEKNMTMTAKMRLENEIGV